MCSVCVLRTKRQVGTRKIHLNWTKNSSHENYLSEGKMCYYETGKQNVKLAQITWRS